MTSTRPADDGTSPGAATTALGEVDEASGRTAGGPPGATAAGVDSGADAAAGTDADAATPTPGPAASRFDVDGSVPPDTGRRSWPLVLALLVVLCVPLAVAVAVLHGPRWYPLLDLAQTELRVRDVGGPHTPLVGLAGRIQAYGRQGSHPGPLSFLTLWPGYKLFGSTSWALQVASVGLHAAAMAGILAVAHRRGGVRLALAFAAVLAVLLHGYGTGVFVEPWNPYMPVLWWLLFLLAVWSVLCGDVAMLPVAVFAGSFCMQTHVSYLGLVGGMAGLAAVAVAAWAIPHGDHRPGLRRLLRWTGASAALGLLLWLPPLIDQATNDPGNASMIVENFRHPNDDPIGLRRGLDLVAVHLDVWRILTGHLATEGSAVPALVLLAAWAGAVVVAWRMRHQALLRLHAVVAAALVLGVVSASQILGEVWYYLALWAWGIAALVVVATVWTFAAAAARPGHPEGQEVPARPRRAAPALAGAAALAVVVVAWVAMFTNDAAHAEEPAARLSLQLSQLAPGTVEALDAGVAGTGGRDGHYLVTWTDPVAIGATGFGLLLELERQGFDVGVSSGYATGAVEHRVMDLDEATGQVDLVVGEAGIERASGQPGAVVVAESDVRTPADVERYEALRADVVADLEAVGASDLEPRLDTALMAVAIDPRVPASTRELVADLADIGSPAAVIVTPL
jgi:hypothetical protein